MRNLNFVLLFLALVCFACATFGVNSKVNLTAAGLALLTMSMFVR